MLLQTNSEAGAGPKWFDWCCVSGSARPVFILPFARNGRRADAAGAAAGGLVQSGVNGFVVPERNSDALADAMAKILIKDKLRAAMEVNARIIAAWDNHRMMDGFKHAIEYALGHHASMKVLKAKTKT